MTPVAGKSPDWDPAKPSESMRRQADWFVEEARTTFLKAGTHVELFFLFKPDGSYSMGHPPPDMDKATFAGRLRESIRQNQFYSVVHIVEAWVYIPRKPNDHTTKQILAGEMAVSDLKKGDKTEALIVRYECRDGTQRMWISPIVRPKTGGVALGDALEMGDEVSGRFGSLF